MSHSYPPIDFPFYGIDEQWTGPRWRAFANGELNKSLDEVTLGHGDRPRPVRGRPWVQVTTQSSKVYAKSQLDAIGRQRDLAFKALFTLVEAVRPDVEEEARRRYNKGLMTYIGERSRRVGSWARTTWLIDGVPHEARFARFAGAWTGLVDLPGDVSAFAVGYGVSPREVRLAQIVNADAYGFDLTARIVLPDTLEDAGRVLGEYQWAEGPSWTLHADQKPFLGPIPESAHGRARVGVCAAPGCTRDSVIEVTFTNRVKAFGTTWGPKTPPLTACDTHDPTPVVKGEPWRGVERVEGEPRQPGRAFSLRHGPPREHDDA